MQHSLPRMRRELGLEPADTWETLREQDVPMIVPMLPGTFPRPDDWAPRTDLTDFIFLRSAAPGAGTLEPSMQACPYEAAVPGPHAAR